MGVITYSTNATVRRDRKGGGKDKKEQQQFKFRPPSPRCRARTRAPHASLNILNVSGYVRATEQRFRTTRKVQ